MKWTVRSNCRTSRSLSEAPGPLMHASSSYQLLLSDLPGIAMTTVMTSSAAIPQLSWVTSTFAGRPPTRSGVPRACLNDQLIHVWVDQLVRIDPGCRCSTGWWQEIVVLELPWRVMHGGRNVWGLRSTIDAEKLERTAYR